jgi:hypothetical protein
MGHFSSAFELGFRLEPYSLGSFVGRFDKKPSRNAKVELPLIYYVPLLLALK